MNASQDGQWSFLDIRSALDGISSLEHFGQVTRTGSKVIDDSRFNISWQPGDLQK